jgi:hypothetical protein
VHSAEGKFVKGFQQYTPVNLVLAKLKRPGEFGPVEPQLLQFLACEQKYFVSVVRPAVSHWPTPVVKSVYKITKTQTSF